MALSIDYIGFALVALGLGCLQVFLDKGQEDDWFGSTFICWFAGLAFFGILAAIIWELGVAHKPIVDLRLLAKPSFFFSNVLMFCVGFVLNSTTVMLPQFVQQILGLQRTNAGLILMGGGFVLMVMMPIVGNLIRVIQPKYLMFTGLLLTSFAMFNLTGFNTQVSFNHLALARVFQCIGLPLFFCAVEYNRLFRSPAGQEQQCISPDEPDAKPRRWCRNLRCHHAASNDVRKCIPIGWCRTPRSSIPCSASTCGR